MTLTTAQQETQRKAIATVPARYLRLMLANVTVGGPLFKREPFDGEIAAIMERFRELGEAP